MRHRWRYRIIVGLCLTALLCLVFPGREVAQAGVWDNARDYYDTYGNAAVFRPTTGNDGIIYCATVGAQATGGTKYRTIGWRIRMTDGSGNLLQDIYCAVGGSYLARYSVVASDGYEYNLYGFSLGSLRGRMNRRSLEALKCGNCRMILDACMVVTRGGVALGSMNDSGSTGGTVYMDYSGISSAEAWTEASREALHSYFGKTVQGLFFDLSVAAGEGIQSVSGGGVYCYGTAVTLSATVARGYEFGGWRGTDYRGTQSFTVTVAGNYRWTAYGAPKWVKVCHYRNLSTEDSCRITNEYTYGRSNQFIGQGISWRRAGYHPIGWSTLRYTDEQVREARDGELVTYPLNTPVSGDWIIAHHRENIPLYMLWRINHYYFDFDGNKAAGGAVDTMEADSDEELILPDNGFEKPVENCRFVGWDLDPEALEQGYNALEEYSVMELVTAAGKEYEDQAHVTLYAIWDYAPCIAAGDLYYSLDDAHAGIISPGELARYVKVTDREDGPLEWTGTEGLPEDAHNGFYIENYPEDSFCGSSEGNIPITFVAVDHVGNETRETIRVHLVDTTVAMKSEAVGNIRFIDGSHWEEEKGGLSDRSVWRRRPEYLGLLKGALGL